MKVLGIEIERKTDILAMAAFLISTGTIIGQFAILLRGAEVSVDGPRQIILFFVPDIGGKAHLNAISTQIYVNNGSPGYGDILKSETLSLKLGTQVIELRAQESVDSFGKGKILDFRSRAQWRPSKINAGDFISNETLFVPYPAESAVEDANFIDEAQFLELIGSSSSIEVGLSSKTYGGQSMFSSCTVKQKDAVSGISSKGWASLVCVASKKSWLSSIITPLYR